MDSYKEVLYAAGLPALISTGITLVYFLLKAYQFAVYALSHKTEGRLAAATPGGRQQEHSSIEEKKAARKFMNKYPEVFQTSMAQGSNNPPGSISLSRRRKDICIAARRNAEEYSGESSVRENGKDCKAEGIEVPKTLMGKDPVAHMMTPQEYLQKVAAGQMLQMNNHEMMVELAAKNDQTKILMMEFRDLESPKNK